MNTILSIPDNIGNVFSTLNNSKYFLAIMMIMLQIGSKYIEQDVSNLQKKFLSATFFKRFMIFTICFIATKDVALSLIVTASFIIIVMGLFHEESPVNILPSYLKEYDTDGDGTLSPKEIKQAYLKLVREGKIKD